MTSDLDVWRSAHVLIRQHGRNAALIAAQRADELLAAGDIEGQSVWKRIRAAITAWEQADNTSHERTN